MATNPLELKEPHSYCLAKTTFLSGYQVMKSLRPIEVITVLNKEKISFVLVGLHGLSGWIQSPRGTEDVDVVVASRHHKKAVKALLAAFPYLDPDDQEVVTRLRDRETRQVVIDVIKPNQPLIREVLKATVRARIEGQEYHIPSLEMALALKFAPMVSLNRSDEKKYLDAHDFIRMVRKNPEIDLEKLAELGELVYPGGGQEILEKVRCVRAGEKLNL